MEFWKLVEAFLVDPKWLGVQGIITVVALTAASAGAIDLWMRWNRSPPVSCSLSFKSVRKMNDPEAWVKFTVRAEGIVEVLEPTWLLPEGAVGNAPTLPHVMTHADGEFTIQFRILESERNDAWAGIAWIEPRRTGSILGASRITLGGPKRRQEWVVYRWWRLRKQSGRWVAQKPLPKKSPLGWPPDVKPRTS